MAVQDIAFCLAGLVICLMPVMANGTSAPCAEGNVAPFVQRIDPTKLASTAVPKGAVEVEASIFSGGWQSVTIQVEEGPGSLNVGEVTQTPSTVLSKTGGIINVFQGGDLTYWAARRGGGFEIFFMLSGAADGPHSVAVTLKYGETTSMWMYDSKGEAIARLHLTAASS